MRCAWQGLAGWLVGLVGLVGHLLTYLFTYLLANGRSVVRRSLVSRRSLLVLRRSGGYVDTWIYAPSAGLTPGVQKSKRAKVQKYVYVCVCLCLGKCQCQARLRKAEMTE